MAVSDDGDGEAHEEKSVREALPAGHPLSWAILVAGTSLAGTVWPGWGGSLAERGEQTLRS